MNDRKNEVEYTGLRIKPNHIKDVQNLMKQYQTIRFLYNPQLWERQQYFDIGFGGNGPDMSAFSKELYESGWLWEEEKVEVKVPWWKKLFWSKK